MEDLCLSCLGDGAEEFAGQLLVDFALTKTQFFFELLCRDVSFSSNNGIAIVDIDVLQQLKIDVLVKVPAVAWKSRMEPPTASPECGIPHPGDKVGD